MALTTPQFAAAQADAPALLLAARAQIEEFAYDSANKLLARVLRTPSQPVALIVRANTLYAINELNRVTDGRATARGVFLEALRLDPLLVVDSLAHLHSDANAVFAEALALTPPATKSARAAAAAQKQEAAASGPGRADTPEGAAAVPAHLPARLVKIPDGTRTAVLARGFDDKSPNVLDPPCVSFMVLFWDVLGGEVDPSLLCSLSNVLSTQTAGASQTLINYTKLVRKKDGAIELDRRPSPIAEWVNEATGKRLQFNMRGDSVLVTDMTPIIALTRMTPLAMGADSRPTELSASHAHRIGACHGTLTFDGNVFSYADSSARASPLLGGHTFRFRVNDVVAASGENDRGAIRARAGVEEQFVVRGDWRRLLVALVAARRR